MPMDSSRQILGVPGQPRMPNGLSTTPVSNGLHKPNKLGSSSKVAPAIDLSADFTHPNIVVDAAVSKLNVGDTSKENEVSKVLSTDRQNTAINVKLINI